MNRDSTKRRFAMSSGPQSLVPRGRSNTETPRRGWATINVSGRGGGGTDGECYLSTEIQPGPLRGDAHRLARSRRHAAHPSASFALARAAYASVSRKVPR